MSYRITIVNDQDEVLEVINIDGFNLTMPLAQQTLGELVASGMGSRNVVECARRKSIRAYVQKHGRPEVCECIHTCADDPATRCSLSGEFHTHPGEPCPVHPDAPCTP